MKIGILGTRWGRTHVGTFRAAGCTIHAMVGRDPLRAREVARQEGVPHSVPEALEDVDIVVIATPADTHAELIDRWQPRWLWCEKPLCAAGSLPRRLGVNYAFPFLPAARRLVSGGRPRQVRVEAGVGGGWCLREVAMHPLSWLHQAVGPLAVAGPVRYPHSLAPGAELQVELLAGEVPFELSVGPAAHGEIRLSIALEEARLDGEYRPGQGWRYSGDPPGEGTDPWYAANCASTAAFVSAVRGDPWAPELFDGARAAALEDPLLALREDLQKRLK